MSDSKVQAPQPKPAQKLNAKNFEVAAFRFNRWSAVLDEDQTLDDALNPAFWAHHAGRLAGTSASTGFKGRGDIIELRKPSHGSFYAELLVVEAATGFVRVELLMKHDPRPVIETKGGAFVIRWNVGKLAYDVIRDADKHLMAGGLQSRDAAAEWISQHVGTSMAA